MERSLALLTIVGLGLGFGWLVLLDTLAGVTVFPGFLPVATLLAVSVGVAGRWSSRKQLVGLVTLAITVGMIALRFVALNPVKPFREFHRQLQSGMSEQAVLGALADRFPVGGRFVVPTVHRSGAASQEVLAFTLNRADGRYNSEIILATFEGDSLVGSEYLPD